MSNTNNVTFTIAATLENQEIIANMTALLVGGKPAMETPEKPANKKAAEKPETDGAAEITLVQFKTAAKKAKTDHDEDFAMETLTANGVDVAATLGRSLSKVDAKDYTTIMEAWAEGPKATTDDDLGDDDLDDDLDDEADVDADAVKVALKAYSKETGRDEAREIMANYKCKSLNDVDKLKPAQLVALMQEIV